MTRRLAHALFFLLCGVVCAVTHLSDAADMNLACFTCAYEGGGRAHTLTAVGILLGLPGIHSLISLKHQKHVEPGGAQVEQDGAWELASTLVF